MNLSLVIDLFERVIIINELKFSRIGPQGEYQTTQENLSPARRNVFLVLEEEVRCICE
jgi:hypothetical protein